MCTETSLLGRIDGVSVREGIARRLKAARRLLDPPRWKMLLLPGNKTKSWADLLEPVDPGGLISCNMKER